MTGETEPKPWANGFPVERWKFSKHFGLWYIAGSDGPKYICLGDRMIHSDYGVDTTGWHWRGSTPENWHGYGFGIDFKEAIEWVQGADYAWAGPMLWSKQP